jgi:Homeodomain-like domain-containing protein
MTLLTLSKKERAGLAEHMEHAHNAKELRRAQALLWLDNGEAVETVATRLHVSGRTLYRWARRFELCPSLSLLDRLADGARSGRPRTAYGVINPLIAAVIDEDPRAGLSSDSVDSPAAAARSGGGPSDCSRPS